MREGAGESTTDAVSVVLPVHNEQRNLAPLLGEITEALSGRSHEIVAVDDGSSDDSLPELRRLRREVPTLRIVALTARSGQSAALMAGTEASRFGLIATMDADGQNDPADLPALLDTWKRHPDSAVVGYRTTRAAGWGKRWQSAVANVVRNVVTGDVVRDTGCALRLVPRPVMLRLPRFDGMHRFLPTLIRRAGVVVIAVPVNDRPRRFGRSHYGVWNRLGRGWRDAWGVRWLRRRRLDYEMREEEGE